jgi:hypothetical protein
MFPIAAGPDGEGAWGKFWAFLLATDMSIEDLYGWAAPKKLYMKNWHGEGDTLSHCNRSV